MQQPRISVVEPCHTEGEPDFNATLGEIEALHTENIAGAVSYIVTDRRVAMNEVAVCPTK
ncbi:hypothetical protein [Nocardia australiensis]|uniref:hypothetical protein n=1 Tax=Nocardia australiensis TaxID=2887191 RepID=UPI001D14D80D|nr:hypothetical protein [Nocardia australiensis]